MIIFTQEVDEDKLRLAYNNDILRFRSNSTNTAPLYCDVTLEGIAGVVGDINIKLYPAPDGGFYLNLKEYVIAIINARNFDDNTITNITSAQPESFIYDFTGGSYVQKGVRFIMYMANGTDEQEYKILNWIAGVEQIGNETYFAITDLIILSPFKKLTANKTYLKYWQGYPFDFAIYSDSDNIFINNITNQLNASFESKGTVNRIYFSDGRTDETIEDVLPLIDGYNELRIRKQNSFTVNDKLVTVEKVPYTCGVYLKWLNKYGGYSYWLFENTFSIDRNTKQIGEINKDFNTLDMTTGRVIQIGKESHDTIRVIAELLNENERIIVDGLLDSPKIYMFTGIPFAKNDYFNWQQVTLKNNTIRTKNAKQPLTNFTFDFELPERYTQTL